MLDTRERTEEGQAAEHHSDSSASADEVVVKTTSKLAPGAPADATNSVSSPSSSACFSSLNDGTAPTTTSAPSPNHRSGRWTPDEKILFLYGLKRFGKGRWKKMSIYLPHRSLVQIKSHAQKVLKRAEAGEDVFRRLDDNMGVINTLIVQAARQRDAVGGTTSSTFTTEAKKKRVSAKSTLPPTNISSKSCGLASSGDGIHQLQQNTISDNPEYGRGAVIAAAALCQLSSLSGSSWDQGAKMQKTC